MSAKDLALFDSLRRLAGSYGEDVHRVLAQVRTLLSMGSYVPTLVDDLNYMLAHRAAHIGRLALDQMSLHDFMRKVG